MKSTCFSILTGLLLTTLLLTGACKSDGKAVDHQEPDTTVPKDTIAAPLSADIYLHEDGKAEYSVLGENDAHATENGKWVYFADTKILQIRKGNDVVHEYEVLEVNDDVLRLKE